MILWLGNLLLLCVITLTNKFLSDGMFYFDLHDSSYVSNKCFPNPLSMHEGLYNLV